MSPLPPPPRLVSFDIFGTVLDWRTGLVRSLAQRGIGSGEVAFDAVVDRQGVLEQASFALYADITARSLVDVLAVPADVAAEIGREVGTWPLFDDSASALRALVARLAAAGDAPSRTTAAMTNSDRAHGADVRRSLGQPLGHWLAAEDIGVYKPSPAFWEAARARTGVAFGRDWWHVSAYADYDLDVARSLGLTTVFVARPHSRRGDADITVSSLTELVPIVDRAFAAASLTPQR